MGEGEAAMGPAGIDSGFRRNDGWGSGNDGWGCCGVGMVHAMLHWIPACAGMTVGGSWNDGECDRAH